MTEFNVEGPDDFMWVAHELFHELEDQMGIRLDPDDHGPTIDRTTGDVVMLFGGADIQGMLGGREHYGQWADITVGREHGIKRWGYRVLWSIKDNMGSPVIWKSYSKQPFHLEGIIRDFVYELQGLAVGTWRR